MGFPFCASSSRSVEAASSASSVKTLRWRPLERPVSYAGLAGGWEELPLLLPEAAVGAGVGMKAEADERGAAAADDAFADTVAADEAADDAFAETAAAEDAAEGAFGEPTAAEEADGTAAADAFEENAAIDDADGTAGEATFEADAATEAGEAGTTDAKAIDAGATGGAAMDSGITEADGAIEMKMAEAIELEEAN